MTRYNRQDVLRILQVSARQLQGWERAGLVDSRDSYTFQELSQLRKLRILSSQRIRSSRISASVAAMQRVSGMTNPLLEAGMVYAGSRVAFRHQGAILDPLSRQLVFDFDARQRRDHALWSVPRPASAISNLRQPNFFIRRSGWKMSRARCGRSLSYISRH